MLEVMLSAALSGIILASVIGASMQLQRNFASHRDYTEGMTNQMLVSDFIAMDLRRAKSITAMDENVLTLKIADYYNTATSGSTRREPSLTMVTRANSRTFEAYYGTNPDAIVQVRYYKQNGTIFREEGARGSIAIANDIDFDVSYPLIPDPDDPGSMVSDTRNVSVTVEFIPKTKRSGFSDLDRQTYIFETINLRNAAN